MPTNDLATLLQDFHDRLRAVEERDDERLTQSVGEQWLLRENDSGVLVATIGEQDFVLVDPAGTPTEATDDGSLGIPDEEPGDGGDGDCDCPPGPEGPQGPPGDTGDCSGCPPGPTGADGESAYEVAVDNGFVGTEADWLASLVGAAGPTGPEGPPGTAFAPTWTTYTPTWSATGGGNSVGNGTLRGRYIQANKLVWYHIRFTWGTTTSNGTGTYRFELPPVTAQPASPAAMGTVILRDNSAGDVRPRIANLAATGPDRVSLLDNGGAVVTNTVPWTWANLDSIDIMGTYEAA